MLGWIFFIAAFLSFSLQAAPTIVHPLANVEWDSSRNPTEDVSHLNQKSLRMEIEKGSNLYILLRQVGVSSDQIMEILKTARPVRNLGQLPAGTKVLMRWNRSNTETPSRLEFLLDPIRSLVVDKTGDKWQARIVSAKRNVRYMGFSGLITESFWESSQRVGLPANLAIELADVFASLIDFNRESQIRDRWRVVVERVYADDLPVGWGNIVAAEFDNQGVIYSAALFEKGDLRRHYYSRNGNSLIRMFLKSPLKFGRITSGFSKKRFHPILKINRPHLGIDYGAPRGTPVLAVGDGVVEYSGWRGGAGKTIKIRHNSTYQTAYKHLSRYAEGLTRGSRVHMGQVIGYVGATGQATGPHLHFEFYLKGRYVDPLSVDFPSADPLPQRYLAELQETYDGYFEHMPPWQEQEKVELLLTGTSGPIGLGGE
ncbi:MAG: peptidoglycan DD-metalloendopeptidase family protein [Bdellovibrionota bacterium]